MLVLCFVIGKGGTNTDAEAFFSEEGGAAVDDGGGVVGLGAVPVEGSGESFGVFR